MKVTVTLLLVLSVHLVSTSECQDGWQVFQDSCYLFVDKEENWQAAAATCAQKQAHLSMLKNAEVDKWLVAHLDKLDKGRFWLGGNYDTNAKYWRWQPSGERISGYFNWASGEPSNKTHEHCLELWSLFNWKWNDAPCNITKRFACQTPALILREKFQGKSYTFHRKPLTWKEANDSCAGNHSNLAVVKNAEVQEWLAAQIDKHSMEKLWIGGQYVTNGGKWKWKPSGEQIDYFNWGPGVPSDHGPVLCLAIHTHYNHTWNHSLCDDRMGYVCQEPDSISKCQGDWHIFQDKCYLFVEEAQNYERAAAFCSHNDAQLPVIKNAEIERWLGAEMDKPARTSSWLGGKYDNNTGQWEWKPSKERISGYFNWEEGQPNIGRYAYCLQLWSIPNYKWHCGSCNQMIRYACQKPGQYTNEGCDIHWANHWSDNICLTGDAELKVANSAKFTILWEEFLDNNYIFYKEAQTWEEANKTCQFFNSSLAEVSNVEESNWLGTQLVKREDSRVLNALSNVSQLFGGFKKSTVKAIWTRGEVKWIPRLDNHDTKYANWGDNQIASSCAHFCVEIRNDPGITLGVRDCLAKNKFVCERSK